MLVGATKSTAFAIFIFGVIASIAATIVLSMTFFGDAASTFMVTCRSGARGATMWAGVGV